MNFWQRLRALVRGSLAPIAEDAAVTKDVAIAPPPPNAFDALIDARERQEDQI